MDDLAFLRARIESYADYTNDEHRVLVDEQVRAYVGEALSRVLERLAPGGTASQELERVLLRCQFADQAVVRALESDTVNDVQIAAIHGVDRVLVGLADDGGAVSPATLDAYVAKIDASLNRRAQIVLSGAAAAPPAPRSAELDRT